MPGLFCDCSLGK